MSNSPWFDKLNVGEHYTYHEEGGETPVKLLAKRMNGDYTYLSLKATDTGTTGNFEAIQKGDEWEVGCLLINGYPTAYSGWRLS